MLIYGQLQADEQRQLNEHLEKIFQKETPSD